jgi:CBS domain containing-hemolysin-like protein
MKLPFFSAKEQAQVLPEPSEQERQISRGLASLRDATAKEVMTPRADVIALGAPVLLSDVVSAVRRSGRSHYPVYRDDLDHLIGVLFVKDVFTQVIEAPGSDGALGVDVTERLREPFVVPETRSALEILAEMRRRKRGFAIVADEYGGFAGVLTVNDLVSELVGELHDEYDRATRPEIVRIDANRHLVDGSASVDDVRESLHCPIPDGEYVTLAGFLLDAFGHIPVENESIQRDGWTYRVAEMDGRRVAKVVIEGASATI